MKKQQLLLAEDDPMLATLLRHHLERSGYEVTIQPNGRTVKEALDLHLPDAIICDIMLPYFSGLELLDHLRNALRSKIPFLVISSASNEATITKAFRMGANDFVPKPISPHELLARLAKELKRAI